MFKRVLCLAIAYLTITGIATATDRFGLAVPGNLQAVKLEEILKNPDAYKGKDVLVEGHFNGVCSDGEDFYFKEGFETVEVVPKDFPVPRLKKGNPIRVYGIVKKKESGKEKEEVEHEIKIEAKGVETK